MTSRPQASCFLITSATASRTRLVNATSSTGWPLIRAVCICFRSGGCGNAPAWVVRIRSVLYFIPFSVLTHSVISRRSREIFLLRTKGLDPSHPFGMTAEELRLSSFERVGDFQCETEIEDTLGRHRIFRFDPLGRGGDHFALQFLIDRS